MKIFLTLVGLNKYYGGDFLEKDMIVFLKKDKGNIYDKEAIEVRLPGLGKIGYIANSYYTVADECFSAGRIYDKIGDYATAKVIYNLRNRAILAIDFNNKNRIKRTNHA